jgi:GxxExxY protein
MNLIYPSESYALVGVCFEVFNELGSGFLEEVYQQCIEIELGSKTLEYERIVR